MPTLDAVSLDPVNSAPAVLQKVLERSAELF